MPATVSTRGVLKASQNRVRTSTALQGSSMWENVIGIVNEERGANANVEALINAPSHGGGGRKKSDARRAAAAEAVLATGGFDTAITSYSELLSLAKLQGAVGGGATRGACKVCGQLGHLTKQCRNQFSKFFQPESGDAGAAGGAGGDKPTASGDSLSGLGSSDSDSSSSSDSEDERRRRKKRKEKKEKKRRRKEKKRRREEREERRDRKESGGHSSKKRHRRSRSRSPARSD